MLRILCLVLLAFAASVFAGSAVAAPSCGELVLRDWSRDGRVDRSYELTCYEDAIDGLPSDLRDYSDAEDVILRALTSAARSDEKAAAASSRPAVATDGRDLPAPLVALGVASLVVLAAGGLGFLLRRRRGSTGMM